MTAFRSLLSAVAAAFVATAADASDPACDKSPLIVENVLFPDAGDTPKSIFLSAGRIEWIGDRGDEPSRAATARRLNGGGAWALPGLIDSHTHFDALAAAKHLQPDLDAQREIFPITMRQTLASGVTTARAHLAAFEDMSLMRSLSGDDCFPAPRMALGAPGLLAGAPTVQSRLMEGFDGAAALSDAIARRRLLGAEWIALHAPSRLTEEETRIVEGVAAAGDVRFMADADSFDNFAASLELPVISAEYINRTPAALYAESLMTALEARTDPLYLAAPIGYYARSAVFAAEPDRALDDSLFAFVSAPIAEEMRATFVQDFDADQYIANAVAAFDTLPGKLAQLRAAGARYVIASDSGSLGQFHHDAVWLEMSTAFAFGLSSEAVIEAATSAPADMLNRSDAGRIKPGALGDIVLYAGDVRQGEFLRDKVVVVIKGGVVFVENGAWIGPDDERTRAAIDEHLRAIAERQ